MKINFKKGFLRLWAFLSISWIAIILLVAGKEFKKDFNIKLPSKLEFEKAIELGRLKRFGKLTETKEQLYKEAVRRELMPEVTFGFDLLEVSKDTKFRNLPPSEQTLVVSRDLKFWRLPQQEQVKVLSSLDEDFSGLRVEEQQKVLTSLLEQWVNEKGTIYVRFLGERHKFSPGTTATKICEYYKDIVNNKEKETLLKFIALIIAPPVILLMLGFITGWVFRGFIRTTD